MKVIRELLREGFEAIANLPKALKWVNLFEKRQKENDEDGQRNNS